MWHYVRLSPNSSIDHADYPRKSREPFSISCARIRAIAFLRRTTTRSWTTLRQILRRLLSWWLYSMVARPIPTRSRAFWSWSYRPSRESRDTVEWWGAREAFELFVSDAVLAEARLGDPAAAARRLAAAQPLTVLAATGDAQHLANALLAAATMPRKAAIDAVHVAIAAVNGMDFLLTWNCAHIANAVMRPRIESVCRSVGFEPPTICTPEELQPEEEP
jgi:hypothetical protein